MTVASQDFPPEMNDLAPIRKLPPPTPAEPIPTLAGERGLTLLRSNTPRMLLQSDENREALARTCRTVLASLTPASPLEIGTVIEALALHYPVLRRTDGENRIVTRQWAADLEGFPLDLIEEAARLWRNSAKDRFPTPGQFKAPVEPILKHRAAMGRRAAEYMDLTA